MKLRPAFVKYIEGETFVAAIVAVVAGATPVVWRATPETRLAIVAASVLFLAASTAAAYLPKRLENPRVGVPLFVILVVLGTFLLLVSHGEAFLVLMPLISGAVLFGGVRLGTVAALGFIVLLGFARARSGQPPNAIVQDCAAALGASVFVVVFSSVTRRERAARERIENLAQELKKANARLGEYATQVEDLATMKERNRLAREIHDSVGHVLTVVHVQLEAAKAQLHDDPVRAADRLDRAQKLTHEGLAEIRHSVAILRASPTANRPLPDAAAALVDECRAAGVEATFTIAGFPRPLAPSIEFALYRAAQEALTNVRRHACASRVAVSLAYGDAEVDLAVKDDGVGGASASGGFGLLGMHERIHLLGGTLHITTSPGQGFALEVRVPT